MAKYIIRTSRFIKQAGQAEPAYVSASPQAPAVIELPDGERAPHGAILAGDPVEKLKPAHSGAQSEAAKPAHEFARRKGRAADE